MRLKWKTGLITSIRLLYKDVGCTQPSNANEAVTAHADQQLISEHHPDANDADSSYYVTIPTKNSYSPFLMRSQVLIRQVVPLPRVPKVEEEILLPKLQKNAMTTKLEQKTSSQEKSKKVWRLPTIPQ
jgi:hypothetical protein